MNRRNFATTLGIVVWLIFTGGCLPGSISLPKNFDQAVQNSKGSTVRFYYWGGNPTMNRWVESVLVPALKQKYSISLERVLMNTPEIVNRLSEEKKASVDLGSIDLFWVNGENFKRAKENGLLKGPLTPLLPSFEKYVNAATVAWDFGIQNDRLESPWGRSQFVFEVDTARVQTLPRKLAELKDWIVRHPGRFTYPNVSDFTGSAFIRQTFLQLNGGSAPFLKGYSDELYRTASDKLWKWLDEVEPYFWKGGKVFPANPVELDALFARGEVDFNMSYNKAHAQSLIEQGLVSPSVRTFVLDEGSLANVHYLAIPFNAQNPSAAVVLADFLLQPEMQLSKTDPRNWGDNSVIDPSRLSATERTLFASIRSKPALLSNEECYRAAMSEIPSEFLLKLQADWLKRFQSKVNRRVSVRRRAVFRVRMVSQSTR